MDKEEFSKILDMMPQSSGCYIFYDKNGIILYIGKSINIKNRLKSYLDSYDRDIKTNRLIRQASRIETISTESEKDALLLENNLIKKNKPVFNVLLKDDKQYPLLEIDISDDFPTISLKRKVEEKSRIYFGPFISTRKLRQNIKLLRRLFKIRACSGRLKPSDTNKPCLYHQIGNCSAPCCRKISKKEYQENVRDMLLFLKGKNNELLEILNKKMIDYSNNQMYEEASYTRDNIRYLKSILQKQKVIIDSEKDIDVISTYIEGEYIVISTLFVRNRNLIDKKDIYFYIRDKIIDDSFLYNFILNQYSENSYVPDILVLNNKNINRDILQKILGKNKKEIKIVTRPKKQLLNLMMTAEKNAAAYFEHRLTYHHSYIENIMQAIKGSLNLKKTPSSIDCFDISNLFGKNSVGVCIRFQEGHPKKSLYRRFNLKNRINDFEGMKETVYRRYENLAEKEMPDLIIIDGGAVQLSKALESLSALNMEIPVISISKINDKNQLYEKIHMADSQIIDIRPKDSHLLFLSRVRDEAHRFAVSSHRAKRKNDMIRSLLEEIHGIGPEKRKHLLSHFKSVDEISRATIKELSSIKGISPELAVTIKTYMKSLIS